MLRMGAPRTRHASGSARALTQDGARAFYDCFVWLQEWQRWYESPALDVLVREGAFSDAHAVFELGCGTGRLAERLLAREMPEDSRYLGVDVSPRMVERTRRRIARFGSRAEVQITNGSLNLPIFRRELDRFVSAYVLDLLSDEDAGLAVDEAYRALAPGGRLCIASLGQGTTRASRALCRAWEVVYRIHPVLVGGCRPVDVIALLPEPRWEILHAETLVALAVPSHVVVARRRDR